MGTKNTRRNGLLLNWLGTRIARWFSLRPKIPNWVYFGEPWNGKC
jgi:hypothetical protein